MARLLTGRGRATVGTSGGGVLAVALRKAKELPAGSNMVVMLPDTGERYLSTPLFDDVPADMTAEEKAYFDSVPATTAFPQPLPQPNDEGRQVVRDFIATDTVSIVAMESCEFCWTIFKFLKADARRSVFAAARGRETPLAIGLLRRRSVSPTRRSTSTPSSTRPATRAT